MNKIIFILLIGLICLTGCAPQRVYELPQHAYYLNPAKNIDDIGRVALLEMANQFLIPDLSMAVTDSLYQEIQKTQLFSVVTVPLDDPAWRRLQLHTDESFSYEELALISDLLDCDAILVGTITNFEPYPYMAIGLRLRLIDLSDGGLCWAMEQVWDTTDKNTRERIEAYYNPDELLLNDENLSGHLGSVSTLKFLKFVSYEIAATMQP